MVSPFLACGIYTFRKRLYLMEKLIINHNTKKEYCADYSHTKAFIP